ncbi:hypothetical protein [Haliangium sp.]|uniref:hypothetical protein n=1 Tax=Haliangium sp. TaxID=2663208 RepID=UPI003D13883A
MQTAEPLPAPAPVLAPYIVREASAERPLTVIQLSVYADRIVCTEAGHPYSVHSTAHAAAADVEQRCRRVRVS